MKKKLIVMLMTLMLGFVYIPGASAAIFTMQEDSFNRDGGPISSFPTPYDFGAVTWSTSFNTPGSHFYITFIDPEIDEVINTFFNEYGAVSGAPAAGQSWEIDEPGYTFGDIYTNFVAGTLDNSNGVSANTPDDVSMALGWNFTLAANEVADLTFFLTDVNPGSGFYLSQTDPDSNATLYFYSTLDIHPEGPQPAPEPATLILLATGLAGLIGMGRKVKL